MATTRKRWFFMLLLLVSMLHMSLIGISLYLSSALPTLREISVSSENEATSCYWVSAAMGFPRCGDNVMAGEIWSQIYGYWIYLWVWPVRAFASWAILFSGAMANSSNGEQLTVVLFSVGFSVASLAFIAPILFLIWATIRAVVKLPHRILRKQRS